MQTKLLSTNRALSAFLTFLQVFSSQNCSITEPVYGHKFDFNGLHSDLAHVVQSLSNDVFEFNVCGNLTHSCNGESNVAACLKKGGKEYVLGM